MDVKIEGSLVVVTGCTRGLGEALVRYFAREGALVVGCGRSATALDTLRRELGAKHEFAAVDVSDATAVDQWAASVVERIGAPVLLLNNQGPGSG